MYGKKNKSAPDASAKILMNNEADLRVTDGYMTALDYPFRREDEPEIV